MEYRKLTVDEIIQWCQENNQVEWLKAAANRERDYDVYPRIKNEEGKMVADKSQPPKKVRRPITYNELKADFAKTFMPEILPQPKKKTFRDKIAAL